MSDTKFNFGLKITTRYSRKAHYLDLEFVAHRDGAEGDTTLGDVVPLVTKVVKALKGMGCHTVKTFSGRLVEYEPNSTIRAHTLATASVYVENWTSDRDADKKLIAALHSAVEEACKDAPYVVLPTNYRK
jgi:hypothetical protein